MKILVIYYKLFSNFIKTYQNIKICIKEDIQMKEIVETVQKNSKIKFNDLNEEKNFMSALIWKKFFKKNKNSDEDDLFFDEDNNNKNELLNKKRKTPDYNDEENKNDYGNNKDIEDNNQYPNDDDFDKLCDDDDLY